MEVTFYALLPLWALAMRRLPGTVRSSCGGLRRSRQSASRGRWSAVLGASDPDHANTSRMLVGSRPTSTVRARDGAGRAERRSSARARARAAIGRRPWAAWLVAGAAFVVVSVGIGLSPENRLDAPMSAAQALGRHWLYALVAVGVLLPAVFGPQREGAVRAAAGRTRGCSTSA